MANRIAQKTSDLKDGSRFGEFGRYKLHLHDGAGRGEAFRFWMVLDAETPDELTGAPSVIRQEKTIEAAVAGLVSDAISKAKES